MQLAKTLRAIRCPDSPEKFRNRLIDELIRVLPEQTIDDVLCNPKDSGMFCEVIQTGIGCEGLEDFVVLNALINIRKRKDCPTNLKVRRTRVILEQALRQYGCMLSRDEFRQVVSGGLDEMFPGRTADNVICHPDLAMEFCDYVRAQVGNFSLPDRLVLSTALNVRKSN